MSFLRTVFLALCLSLGGMAAGQTQSGSIDAMLDQARQQIDDIQAQLKTDVTDAILVQLRSDALGLQAKTDQIATSLAPQLANVQARLTELGPKPSGAAEPPDVAEQRAALDKSRGQLDANVKLAKLIAIEAAQVADQIVNERRSRFSARLGERTDSILATPFWADLRDGLGRDTARLRQLGRDLSAAARAPAQWVWPVVLAFGLAMLGLRAFIGHRLRNFVSLHVPPGRLRRSLYALLQTLLSVAAPGLVAHAIRLGFTWNQNPPDSVKSLLVSVVGAVCFGAYVAGLGKALLSPKRPSWRLPPLPDRLAERMRRYPLLLAIVIVIGWQLQRLAALVNTGLATAVAINCVFALVLGTLMAHVLRRGERLRHEAEAAGDLAPRPLWLVAFAGLVWAVLVLTLIGILVGYVALGGFIVAQVAWISTVLASVYLLSIVIDDACMTWLATQKQADADGAAPHSPKLRDQAAVLLSGVSRVLLALVALVFIAAPFGQGPLELFQRTDQIRQGIAIGEIRLQPGTVLQALLVLVLGLVGVRALQRWLDDRFLPTTSLDPGMRSSATTLLGYVGAILAIALSLSAVGLGLERIAWVASALSVGIGFGLQAVVSNFVSGLILLAERPVKVGDWVSLGGVEGDIRRINVRATEIQLGDRSTVIVPNSEFITKTVRNVTLANPLGLVQIKLTMPVDTDVERVRSEMLEAFQQHADVIDQPAPSVALDGIDVNGITFNATGFVNSPRQAYNTKSALLFEVLRRLREAKLPISKPSTMVLREVPATPPAQSSP